MGSGSAPRGGDIHLSGIAIVWAGIVALAVIGVSVFAGVQLASSNSDIICTRSFSDSGSCTNGSWGSWQVVSQGPTASCTYEIVETRTYTGVRNTITGDFSVRANLHTHCNLSDDAFRSGSGSISSRFAACQIQETRARSIAGSGIGASCSFPSGTSTIGKVVSDTNTETEGEVDASLSTTTSGTYQDYLNVIDARFATSSIWALPSLVRAGDVTSINWSSGHVKSCTVSGTNGDSWPKQTTQTQTDADGNQIQVPVTPAGLSGSETSSPIQAQTIYTLACTTAVGTKVTQQVIVNILPVFQER